MSLIEILAACTLVSTVWPRSRRSGNRNSPQALMKEALSDESGLDGRSLYAIQKRLRTREVLLARAAQPRRAKLVIADLAKEAGVSVATVYNHFDGPEAILKAITEDLVNRSIADASSLVRSNGPQAATELFPTLLYESIAYLNRRQTPQTPLRSSWLIITSLKRSMRP